MENFFSTVGGLNVFDNALVLSVDVHHCYFVTDLQGALFGRDLGAERFDFLLHVEETALCVIQRFSVTGHGSSPWAFIKAGTSGSPEPATMPQMAPPCARYPP